MHVQNVHSSRDFSTMRALYGKVQKVCKAELFILPANSIRNLQYSRYDQYITNLRYLMHVRHFIFKRKIKFS